MSLSTAQKNGLQRMANTITSFGIPYSANRKLHHHIWQCLLTIPEQNRPPELQNITEVDINETRLVLSDGSGLYNAGVVFDAINAYYQEKLKYAISIDDIPAPGYELVYG